MEWFFLLVMLILMVGAVKFEYDHSLPMPSPLIQHRQRDRAQRIIAQGGPQSLQEYLEIFPEACPRCGGRTLYESVPKTPSFLRQLLLQLLRRKLPKSWVCTSCGHNNLSEVRLQPLQQLCHGTSPYLPMEQARAIAPPPYPHPAVYPVYLHNDQETVMEFVVEVLTQVFELPEPIAIQIMIVGHTVGQSFVMALPKPTAQERIVLADEMAKKRGYPLRFTLEEEWLCDH